MTSPSIPDVQESTELIYSHTRPYRFWPAFIMSFLRTFFFSIYSLALPNYLIYIRNLNPSLVGTISSISSVAYIIGPVIGRKITNKIGIRKSLILSHSISVISIFVSILFSQPWILILSRAIDGFVNGFFWPNVLNLITNWENNHPTQKKKDYLKIFNLSWNFGLIGGYIIGYFIVFFFGGDYIALIISAIFASLLIPSAFMVEKSDEFVLIDDRPVIIQDFRLNQSKVVNDHSSNQKEKPIDKLVYETKDSLINVPILLAWGGILVYASAKSIFKFTLPYFLLYQDLPSYWVYITVLFQQIAQITGLILIRKMNKMRYGYFSGMIVLFSFTLIFLFNPHILIIAIMNILAGVCVGFMQGVAQRIVLDYGKESGSRKYSMLNETFAGISFGIIPLIAGFLLEINIIYDFIFLALELTLLMILLVITHFKYRKKEKMGYFKT